MKRNVTSVSNQMDVSVRLPKDAIFKLLSDVINDLDVCSLDGRLHAAIRSRDVDALLDCVSRYDARSIIERLGSTTSNAEAFGKLYQVGALIKKFPFPNRNTFEPAFESFKASEQVCRDYNTQNFRALLRLSKDHPKYFGLVQELRKEIYDLIGAAPNTEQVYINGLHGPGQTAGGSFRNGEVTDFFKFTSLPYTVSSKALTHAKTVIENDPRWIGALLDYYRSKSGIAQHMPIKMHEFWDKVFKVVDTSTITSVPKTALTDRFIAMEPTMNVFLQLGVDRVLRETLRKGWGYDLNSQELNKRLAEEGSKYGNYATIDLKAASDRISLMLVYLLFPPEWISLLLDLRMDKGKVKKENIDETFEFHKLSSMGNGFTFAIESIIFGACTRVAMRRTKVVGESAVFGDDIICPTLAAPFLVEVLGLCGFDVNSEKSFLSGPFRESCGADFYLGYNVRPLFITSDFQSVPRLFHLTNSFFLLERKEYPHYFGYSGLSMARTRKRLLSWIPPDFRAGYRGPISDSTDTHLFSDEPLRINSGGYRYFFKLIERPHLYRPSRKFSYRTFHLRKLMVQPKTLDDARQDILRPDRPIEKWDWRKKFNKGNAFDITRRGHTFFKRVRTICCDKHN